MAGAGVWNPELEGEETALMARSRVEKRAKRAKEWLQSRVGKTLIVTPGSQVELPIYTIN